ncbi:unnamed protein product [Rotaria sp. Silwood1]|nr:unnamed protein product [Rotaria sp. Silwood1]CAF4997025.1 unnamed protein product [Rotaria sp. Silwood1]
MTTKPNQNIIIMTFTIIFILIIYHYFIYRQNFFNLKQLNQFEKFSSKDFYPCIAIIVEFRTTDKIISVVHNVNYHIPITWPIQIFHGITNENFIRNSTLSSLISSGKIILTLMKEIYDRSRTNILFTDAKFWKKVRGEKILLFQIDSIMCSNSPHKIIDYLQYDYVGAPWDISWYTDDRKYLVGNGGFSLRTRRKILELIALIPYDRRKPEDVWYAQNLHRVNASIAPVHIAKTFSVESIYYERPVGIHRFSWNCNFRRKISETCPESVMVLPNGGC